MSDLTRFGISMESQLLKRFDQYISEQHYSNRSEAIRDLVREQLIHNDWKNEEKEIVGTITLVYDHHQRELSEKLTEYQHAVHEQVISTMHVHLNHHHCLEVLVVKGKTSQIQELAKMILSTKGVKHGKLVMTSSAEGL